MNEEEKFKISVPLYTNQELFEMENIIQNDFESIVDKVSRHVYHDRELIALQKIIEKQQKELEPIKKLNIPVETLVSEFNRLEDLEDNTEMLKSELEKKDKIIDKMAEMLVKVPVNIDEPEKLSLAHFLNEHLEEKKQRVIDYILNLVEKENK